MFNKFLLFIVQFLLFAQLAFSASLYCDYTNGNDANDCTNGTTQLCQTLQRCVDVATGGDTINIANTSAQVLAAPITWNTGWTADNTKYTIFQAWDNGGSITIQRPDEATARVGATIDGNSAVSQPFSDSSAPNRVIFKNIKFTGGTTWLMRLHGYGSAVYDSEIYGTTAALPLGIEGGGQSIVNTYIHNTTSSGNPIVFSGDAIFYNNFIQDNAPASGQAVVNQNGSYRTSVNNNIIFVPSGRVGFISNSQNIILNNNTFIAEGGTNTIGAQIVNNSIEASVYNNLFYNFDGSGDVPLDFDSSSYVQILGFNAYFDCNSPDTPTNMAIDLTANDVTGAGDPFVDSANDDYSVTGSTAEDAGLGNP